MGGEENCQGNKWREDEKEVVRSGRSLGYWCDVWECT